MESKFLKKLFCEYSMYTFKKFEVIYIYTYFNLAKFTKI